MEPERYKCAALFKNNWFCGGVHWENCSTSSCHGGGHDRQLSFHSKPSPRGGLAPSGLEIQISKCSSCFSPLPNDKWLPCQRELAGDVPLPPTSAPHCGTICQQPLVLGIGWGRGSQWVVVSPRHIPLWQIRLSNPQEQGSPCLCSSQVNRSTEKMPHATVTQECPPVEPPTHHSSPQHPCPRKSLH